MAIAVTIATRMNKKIGVNSVPMIAFKEAAVVE